MVLPFPRFRIKIILLSFSPKPATGVKFPLKKEKLYLKEEVDVFPGR
jgi:hypothetical protein